MTVDGNWRDAVALHPPESLRHANERFVLGNQRLVFAERSFGNHDCLREIAGIDDDELRTNGRDECRDEDDDKDKALHVRPPYRICARSVRAPGAGASYAGRSRSFVRYT